MGMAGDGCVALAVDKRFASGPQMVNVSPRRSLVLHSKLMVGFTGLDGDIQNVSEELSIHVASKMSRETGGLVADDDDNGSSRAFISPRSMAALTSHVLYSKRASPFYCEPLIVGLQAIPNAEEEEGEDVPRTNRPTRQRKKYKAFLCGMDILGAQMTSMDFCCSGAAKQSMYGTAEAMWKPNMKADELGRVCGRAFLSALERDCLSGYGAIVYVITSDGITEYDLVCRND